MRFYRFVASTIIAPVSICTLVACGSDSDDDSDFVADNNPTEVLLFDEATDGDIVNDPNNPHPLQLVAGENLISAAIVFPDVDYLTINVPAGHELAAIELADYTSTDDRSFMGIQAGSVFTELVANPAEENLLGYVHFGMDMTGTDILPTAGLAENAQGFTPPLDAGDYSLWIQETGTEPVNFSLRFVVVETP